MGLIKGLFYKGEYHEVLEKTYEDPAQIKTEHFVYVIGSLSFLGRIQEAEALYSASRNRIDNTQKSYVYFFLALAWTRRSQYKKAKRYLLLNRSLSASLKHKNAEIKFLVEQGISFFLFFLGKFEKSLYWSEKSLASSMAVHDFWMMALAHDLLANNLIQNGHIHEALRHFREALNHSKRLKNSALINAIEISSTMFSCEYGINLNTSYKNLIERYNLVLNKDAFSTANLGLEYARQLTLRGEWKSAINKLNEISGLIFQSQNRRQEARFNLRWAEIYFLKNEPNTCLHYIRSGRRCLEFVDHTYEMQFLGLEKKVYEQLLKQSCPITITDRLAELSLKFNNIKNNNILSRDSRFKKMKNQDSDDEIHRLLEKAEQNRKNARSIILETGYLSWLYRFFAIDKGEKYILLNLEPKSITYITTDGIFHEPDALSTLNYKILSKLSEGYTTKEELVQSVWGYNYDPLRHDSLIYSTFSNMRKILKHDNRLIETSEMGYSLNAKVINTLETSIKKEVTNSAATALAAPADLSLRKWLNNNLNSRQIQIMQYLDQNQFISVRAVIKLFETSEITANRDLRSLFQKQLVVRIGQGRATQYTKAQEQE